MMLSLRQSLPLPAVYGGSATTTADPTVVGAPLGSVWTAASRARSRSVRGARADPVSLASAAERSSTAGRWQPLNSSASNVAPASSIQEHPIVLAESFPKQLGRMMREMMDPSNPSGEIVCARAVTDPCYVQSGRSTLGSVRPVVRGVCAWSQAVHLAKAAASCRYRIGNFVDLLTGVDVVISARFPKHLVASCRVLSCLRPFLTPALGQLLAGLREQGLLLVADYDDLLFAGEVTGLPESVGGPDTALKAGRLHAYSSGLASFDTITVATRALAAQAERAAPHARVIVVPNGLSEQWVAQGRALYDAFRAGDSKVIRYFAGSPSHDRDFASIIDPLASFLAEHRDVRLEVVGPVTFDVQRFPDGSVAALKSVEYDHLPGMLASTWVNLAPLEPSDFNTCKSALKVLESGAFECPTLASPCDDVLRHLELGAPIVLCRSPHDWYSGLVALLDSDRRFTMGRGVAEHVRQHGMARASLPALLSAFGIQH